MKRTATSTTEKDVPKKRCLLKEKDAYSLSEKKVVYTINGEDFIIRAVDNVNFNGFGLAGRENITRAFYSILTLLAEHRDLFLASSLYGGNELIGLLESISDADRSVMKGLNTIYKAYGDGESATMIMTGVTINEHARVQLSNPTSTHPQIALMKLKPNTDGVLAVHAGVYLYLNELVKLIKHLNTSHSISPTMLGKFPPLPNLSDQELLD